MPAIVKVAVLSPLPQLDRLFDYLIPEGMRVEPGMRLVVPFGRGKRPTDAFAIELTSDSEAIDKLSSVIQVVSEAKVLTANIYKLCRAVADRQAATFADVVKLAVPNRSVKVEHNWLERVPTLSKVPDFDFENSVTLIAERLAFAPINHFVDRNPGWALQFIKTALDELRAGKSSIIVVPDFRDQQALLEILSELNALDNVCHLQSDQAPSAKYQVFLGSLSEAKIIIGSRAAIFAPAFALGCILMLNDSDQSLFEPTSPYLATREVALIRAQLEGVKLVLAAQARSTEVQRLVDIGYLGELSLAKKPQIAVTDSDVRVDSLAYQTIRQAVESGGSALIQVSSAGTATSLFCKKCAQRLQCKHCDGPVGLDSSGKKRCRWCAGYNLDLTCANCGSTEVRQGRAGVTRTVAEFGRAFTGITVIEASGEKTVLRLKPGKRIVVATVGAEPIVEGGYDAVVLLDAQNLLTRDSLRATENAIRQWADAVALLKPTGKAVLVGVPSKLGQQFALWNLNQLAQAELAQRRELKFPPHLRMATVTAEPHLAGEVVGGLAGKFDSNQYEILGPIPSGADSRYIIRYEYSIGLQLANALKNLAMVASAGVTVQSNGRASRAVRIKMDDAEVV